MALIEIDVLVAQALGLALDQLIDIYRIYFPVLQQNEAGTWYDRRGRIVWTCSKGLPGIGYFEEGQTQPPTVGTDFNVRTDGPQMRSRHNYLPGSPKRVARTFEGPFDVCDRVEDYKRAWAYFEAHKEKAAAA